MRRDAEPCHARQPRSQWGTLLAARNTAVGLAVAQAAYRQSAVPRALCQSSLHICKAAYMLPLAAWHCRRSTAQRAWRVVHAVSAQQLVHVLHTAAEQAARARRGGGGAPAADVADCSAAGAVLSARNSHLHACPGTGGRLSSSMPLASLQGSALRLAAQPLGDPYDVRPLGGGHGGQRAPCRGRLKPRMQPTLAAASFQCSSAWLQLLG